VFFENLFQNRDSAHLEGHGFLVLSEVEGSRAENATKTPGL